MSKSKSYLKFMEDIWEKQRKERDRILLKYGVEPPPCGFDIGMGWMPIVEEALDKMIKAGWDKKLAQVKQKFCQLRIYLDGETNTEIKKIIGGAEAKCNETCETCGKPHGLTTPMSGVALCRDCTIVRIKGYLDD